MTLSGETSFHQEPTPVEDFHLEGGGPARGEGSPSRTSPSGAAGHESKRRNIIRTDDAKKRVHAWRVFFRRRNEIMTRCFSDGVYGGKDKALVAATAYLDQLLSCHSVFEHQIWKCNRLRKDNTSGIPGVGRYEAIDARNGRRNVFWRASWTDEQGVDHGHKYYVSCYGEVQAKRLAIAERERQLFRVCKLKAKRVEVQRDLFEDLAET
jgi:hypothetical protein